MKNKIYIIVALIAIATSVSYAQQPPQGSSNQRFAWDQEAPTLADAQGYPDGSSTGIAFTGVTCTGTSSPFVCSAPIPAFTPGNHNITITASNVAGETAKSDPFAFSFVVTPAVPTGIRIISSGG